MPAGERGDRIRSAPSLTAAAILIRDEAGYEKESECL